MNHAAANFCAVVDTGIDDESRSDALIVILLLLHAIMRSVESQILKIGTPVYCTIYTGGVMQSYTGLLYC
jgi:hypothetical protein